MGAKKKLTSIADGTRGGIKRAAKRLFADQGYAATSIRQIAGAASIEGGSIYYHFRGKQAILVSILEDGNRKLMNAADEATASTPENPEEALRLLIHAHLRVLADDPEQFTVVTSELRHLSGASRRKIMDQRDRYERIYRQILEKGAKQGCFRPLNLKTVSFGIIGLLNSVTHWFDPEGPCSASEIADEFSSLILSGLTEKSANSNTN
jgi:TetR/AcrR family transcriptional regulator, cholesterol catabolism regulator